MVQLNGDRSISLSVLEQLLPEEQYQKVVVATEPELITLAEASERFGVSETLLSVWITRGHLHRAGYTPAPKARPRVLVDTKHVAYLVSNPPSSWKRCKSP